MNAIILIVTVDFWTSKHDFFESYIVRSAYLVLFNGALVEGEIGDGDQHLGSGVNIVGLF
jgi:hypothetical protein